MEKIRYYINNELPRTNTNSEFERLRISSVLRSIFSNSFAIFMNPAHPRRGTRMTRIGRIFTDILDQCEFRFQSPNNKPQRSQRTQSRIAKLCALCVLCGGSTLFTACKTWIYTYPCASVSSARSAFHSVPSVFICVHLRLILSMKEKAAAFCYALINKSNTIFNQKSDLNDRHFLLQRA
jgi:hypothetical protein